MPTDPPGKLFRPFRFCPPKIPDGRELQASGSVHAPGADNNGGRAPRAELRMRGYAEAVAHGVGERAAWRPALHGIREAAVLSSACRWAMLSLGSDLLRGAGNLGSSWCGRRHGHITVACGVAEARGSNANVTLRLGDDSGHVLDGDKAREARSTDGRH